ncbi:conserved hypothetical protein [Hyella patelloides LEGE 07179]|uniref:Uncharacterized protein n=1 Tax=Hyella patelloides LEGE 07179 TaxID=945734 RepID=A0A563VS05_9CYAN|nr:PEP-CTERM sorting domain-containing protein [Hyella patelloides]VEP14069.1 conserved hypothetical protein [Hyella patelloides LEGE 07179]
MDFTGDFDPANWTFTTTNADGSVNTTNAPTSITLTGGDDGSAGTTDYTITAPSNETISFSWNYSTSDGPNFDPFIRLLNSVETRLTDDGGADNQSGTDSFTVNSGDTFGFRITTVDGIVGPGSVTISDFASSPSASVPFEFSPALGLVLASGLFGSSHFYRQHKAGEVILNSEA